MEGYSEQTGNTAPRVLIVDDNPEIREIICILLGGEGYEMEEAKNGNQALAKAEEEPCSDPVPQCACILNRAG